MREEKAKSIEEKKAAFAVKFFGSHVYLADLIGQVLIK